MPWYFKHLKSLPWKCTCKKSAWITCAIFEDYLRALDVTMGSKKRKVVVSLSFWSQQFIIVRNLCMVSPCWYNCSPATHEASCCQDINLWLRKKFACLLLQHLIPGSSNSGTLSALTAVWQTLDYSIPTSCFERPGFDSRTVGDQNPQEHESSAWESLQKELKLCPVFESYIIIDYHVVAYGKQSTKVHYMRNKWIKN